MWELVLRVAEVIDDYESVSADFFRTGEPEPPPALANRRADIQEILDLIASGAGSM
jgi:hypothetical protein